MNQLPACTYLKRYGPFEDDEQKFILLDRDLTIGRSEENDIILSSPYVSRQHLVFRQKDIDVWAIMDLGSFNGTFIADAATGESMKMQPGLEYLISEGLLIGLGVEPFLWDADEAHRSDPDYFVYGFKRNLDVAGLCHQFQNDFQISQSVQMF